MTYKEKHKELVDELRKLGVHYQYSDRLPLFVIYAGLHHLDGSERCLRLVDELVKMRTEGLEVPYENPS